VRRHGKATIGDHAQDGGGAFDGFGGAMTIMKAGRHPIQSGGVGDGEIEGVRSSLPPHSK